MTETATEKTALDEVMMSMDIVDTLRRDREIVERELNTEKRRSELIDRLRDIYAEQGITVPDSVLEQGVNALENDRFVYNPPGEGFKRRIAELYVTRDSWGRWVVGGLAGLGIVAGLWYGAVERPRQQRIAAEQVELSQTIPAKVTRLSSEVAEATGDPSLTERAEALKADATSAAAAGNLSQARSKTAELERLADTLKSAYRVRIVTRQGELSGIWRRPRNNPRAQNYYIIVEAVDAAGNIIPQTIKSEETSQQKRVTKWAIRVPKVVFDSVRDDKRDDGIVQRVLVGEKKRGQLEPEWFVSTSGGAITEW